MMRSGKENVVGEIERGGIVAPAVSKREERAIAAAPTGDISAPAPRGRRGLLRERRRRSAGDHIWSERASAGDGKGSEKRRKKKKKKAPP